MQVTVPEGILYTGAISPVHCGLLPLPARNKIRLSGLLLTALYFHWIQLAKAFLCFYLYLPMGVKAAGFRCRGGVVLSAESLAAW